MSSIQSIAHARAIGLDSGVLGLTIFPTEKCNFRCVYCYEDFPNVRLSDACAAAILRLIENRSSDLSRLTIGWFGGEPLLEAPRVIQISQFAKCAALRGGFSFSSHMTTNGYFLNFDLFTELLKSGISSFQISLDGMPNEHDNTRRIAKTGGSFAVIMKNLLSMRQSPEDFEIILRLHLHANNYASLKSLIDVIELDFAGDNRFKVIVRPLLNYTNDAAPAVQFAMSEQKKSIMSYLRERLPRPRLKCSDDVLNCCYAGLPNHFVIRANGKVQKCTVALYDERNDVGELMSDGTIAWASGERLSIWSEGLLIGDLNMMQCPWKVIQQRPNSAEASAAR